MKKIKKIILSITSLFTIFNSFIFLTSCGSSPRIYFGNFESYMSPEVEDQLSNKYNINFQSYKTNEQLVREFNLNYDIAIPSTNAVLELIERNELEKIDWTIFNLNGIQNATDALKLFIPEIYGIILGYDLDNDGNLNRFDLATSKWIINDPEDNLLNYAVPYFFQDFIVGYKKDRLPKLLNMTFNNWSDFFNFMENTYKENKTIAIDDYRTLFSFGKLVQNSNNDVNPLSNESSISDFDLVFDYLPKFFQKQNPYDERIIFNSDSGAVLNNLANPNGLDMGILYNGDLLYAMQGGDEHSIYDENGNDRESDIGFIRPKSGSNIALDFVVVNKNSKIEKNILFNILKDISLTGSDLATINETDLTYLNFDYVQYTTPIKNLYDYIVDPIEGYFSGYTNQDLFIDVFKINISQNDIIKRNENLINDIQKSNMLISYLFTKSKI